MTNVSPAQYNVIGLMSGTSLDGVDIAFCRFTVDNNEWQYEIVDAETISYESHWKKRLLSLETADGLAFQQTNVDYGHYLGSLVSDFILKHNVQADFVASHGHTIFHQPDKKLTVQIGSGAAIAARCKLPVVSDFRTMDVALGGQGAPLVPIGDKMLFSEYDFCLNLGGFANVSYDLRSGAGLDRVRVAYDICPVNIVMNKIAERVGKPYDDGGEMSRQGMVSGYLLNELNQIGFYKMLMDAPKSLGKEWVIKNIDPVINLYEVSDEDLLRTFCEHIAFQIGKSLKNKPKGKLLVTGGGVHNYFLMECIKQHTEHDLVVPDNKTIEYKEALIFAFLGVLRMRNEVNCLSSVTGAQRDSCGGSMVGF
ncbi:MAG: anhydro-N-acetylmuramic acid kinase [Bacteroidetes bacterium]|nr:anhydro-N-acetylmuramic acid kinase [Bacteroidota bacterium]